MFILILDKKKTFCFLKHVQFHFLSNYHPFVAGIYLIDYRFVQCDYVSLLLFMKQFNFMNNMQTCLARDIWCRSLESIRVTFSVVCSKRLKKTS